MKLMYFRRKEMIEDDTCRIMFNSGWILPDHGYKEEVTWFRE